LAAIGSERDYRGQSTLPARIESSPTIKVAVQDRSVLLRREWSLAVETLALVVREFGRELRRLGR
jgi:hypothetical protein